MKWRNQLLALFCDFVFAAFGVLYFRYWVVQKPFGIILFIGEGLAPDRLAAARIYAGSADTALTLDSLSYTALLKNYSNDSATPDSAAAATAMATGVKVNNGALGVDAQGNTLTNLLELARQAGRRTGLITDSRLTNETPASFYAHTVPAENRQELARTLVESGNVDLVLGGGSADFVGEAEGGRRSDGRDLLNEATDAGYDVVRTRAELEAVAWWRWPKVFGVFGPADLAHADEIGPETPQPHLADMVRRGIELLQIHRGGYLLVVDAGLMRKAAEENDAERTLAETLQLDRAVSVALRYAGPKTTVFVCGDVALGGLSVSGYPPRRTDQAAFFARDSLGGPRITWSTGPRGSRTPPDSTANAANPFADPAPTVQPVSPHSGATPAEQDGFVATAEAQPAEPSPPPTQQPLDATGEQLESSAAVYAPAAINTLDDVIAFGTGRGAEALHGTLENTAIFEIIRDNL